jgi:diguanylate cyclase (GGDEF)-like protein
MQKKTKMNSSSDIQTGSRRLPLSVNRVILAVCCVIYLLLLLEIILLTNIKGIWLDVFGVTIYKGVINGVISQLQVLLLILIILNPVKHSFTTAIVLNLISAVGALQATLIKNDTDALVGIVIPVSTMIILVIIKRYGTNLKNQINKIIRFNQIMKENDKRLHELAFYDTLTQLPNRRMIIDHMELLTTLAFEDNRSFFYVLFDLDNFKKINDTMGHIVGDNILQQIAGRWSAIVNKEDLLGRIGGDEFSLVISRPLSKEELIAYVDEFREAISRSILVDRKEYSINASFGIAAYPEDGHTAVELMKNADIALYKEKNSGKNGIMFFSRDMQREIINKMKLEDGLLSSIRNEELYVVFQPMYRCGTNILRGFEALARWRYPELGLVSPAQFIPIAEETGFIVEMGKWIMKTVLFKFKDLQKAYDIKPIVSVNISVVQMIEPFFVPMIKDLLQETGFDSRYLELEITESVLISYPEHIIEVINQLRNLGIRIALDDFGTGFASLSYLQMLPINVLKIDKTFIDKITNRKDMKQIVGNIIALAHHLGMEVVAEGVELEEQLEYLKKENCDYIQGYLLSRPIEEEQIIEHFNLQKRA